MRRTEVFHVSPPSSHTAFGFCAVNPSQKQPSHPHSSCFCPTYFLQLHSNRQTKSSAKQVGSCVTPFSCKNLKLIPDYNIPNMQINCQYCCLRTSVVREGGRERVRKGREILCKYLRAVGTPVCLLLERERERERESSPFRTPQSSLSLSLSSFHKHSALCDLRDSRLHDRDLHDRRSRACFILLTIAFSEMEIRHP